MKFSVTWNRLQRMDEELVTAGSVGTVMAEFSFDDAWDGWARTAVFRGSGEAREVALTSNECAVPWEALRKEGYLRVGVYGARGDRRIPTIWSSPIPVAAGASGADPAQPPTPDVYRQLLAGLGDLNGLKTADRSSLVAAINELCQGGGSSAPDTDETATDQEVEELLDETFGGSGGTEEPPAGENPPPTEDPPSESGETASDEEVEELFNDIFG